MKPTISVDHGKGEDKTCMAIREGSRVIWVGEVKPLEEWHEDFGPVLWWKFPITEPPYSGSPLDENWPSYHTHWTPIPVPETPQ